jgi:carbon monoxide dehydrogenase subunit G
MKLEQSFEVAAPLQRVWQTLIDVEHVAPCLPGAAVTGRNNDGSYNGTFTIKIGPTTASYTGKLEMEQVDEAAHTATMQAQGNDRRGQGGAKATIVSRLTPAGEGSTRVDVDTDYHITGRLAMFGRGGMIEDISERLLKEFAARLQASLLSQGGAGDSAESATAGGGPANDGDPAPPPATAAAPQPAAGAPAGEPTPPPTEASGPAVQATAVAATRPHATVEAAATAATRPHATVPAPPPTRLPSPPGQAEPLTSEPIEGLSLVGSVMLDRVKRNPLPLVGLLVLLLVLLRRRR